MRRNNNRRRPNNQNNNRRAPNAKRTQQDATRTTTRTLNRITNVNLSSVGPNGGTVTYATVLNPLSSFAGAASLADQYEQFRIQKIAVYARADAANQPQVTAQGRLLSTYTLANYSTIATYVDYDSFAAPTEASFLGRDAMKIRSLSPGNFKLVASYAPRVRLSDAVNSLPALVPHKQTTWISTDFVDLDWLGLNLRVTQDSPYWGTDANNCAKCQLFIKATVVFRGLKKDNGAVLALPGGFDPTILTLTSYPSNVLNSGMIEYVAEEAPRSMEAIEM